MDPESGRTTQKAMAKTRMIHSKFWSDGWIRKINPLDRYLFFYFLSNEHTNICGIYELPIETMAFESGIDKEELLNSMLPRLQPKVFYCDGWVIIPNFAKHQASEHPKVQKGVELALGTIPSHILEKAIGYGYPIHREHIAFLYSDSDSDSDLKETDANASPFKVANKETTTLLPHHVSEDIEIIPTDEDGNEISKSKWGKKPKPPSALRGSILPVVKRFDETCLKTLGTTPTGGEGVYKHIERVFTVHKLTQEEAFDVIEEWFGLGKPDHVTIDIMNCFSRKNINEWRARNL